MALEKLRNKFSIFKSMDSVSRLEEEIRFSDDINCSDDYKLINWLTGNCRSLSQMKIW